jgi:hypothetical protein
MIRAMRVVRKVWQLVGGANPESVLENLFLFRQGSFSLRCYMGIGVG